MAESKRFGLIALENDKKGYQLSVMTYGGDDLRICDAW